MLAFTAIAAVCSWVLITLKVIGGYLLLALSIAYLLHLGFRSRRYIPLVIAAAMLVAGVSTFPYFATVAKWIGHGIHTVDIYAVDHAKGKPLHDATVVLTDRRDGRKWTGTTDSSGMHASTLNSRKSDPKAFSNTPARSIFGQLISRCNARVTTHIRMR